MSLKNTWRTVIIFGELWNLKQLSEERKSKWRRKMDWLLPPTNYMVELVPAKQNNANGRIFEFFFFFFVSARYEKANYFTTSFFPKLLIKTFSIHFLIHIS
ncbi:RHO guanyl-nucleotide exchange factor [Medicago truncatula]|uniref:RHO guanyl-nucleotide exchange factor n=1 Tax=Medicago truncatula TaxID=3880 RepID=G7K5E4_MEDTR|nr:RHO guanyl-nucleotide exchange factor [Medicago truncatula]